MENLMKEEFKGEISTCPKCNSDNITDFMSAGELMDPHGEMFGELSFLAVLPGVPDVMKCLNCKQLFDTDGRLWNEADLIPKKQDKTASVIHPECGHNVKLKSR